MTRRMARNNTTFNFNLLTGVVAGSAVAAGLILYFRPRLRRQIMSSAADVVDGVADVADTVAERADEIRNDVAAAVEHGAHAVSHSAREVERFAKASKTVHQKHT